MQTDTWQGGPSGPGPTAVWEAGSLLLLPEFNSIPTVRVHVAYAETTEIFFVKMLNL